MDQLPRLGKRELICLLLFTCNYVVFVWRGFLFLWVLGTGYVILLWHSLSLPYNYFSSLAAIKNRFFLMTRFKYHVVTYLPVGVPVFVPLSPLEDCVDWYQQLSEPVLTERTVTAFCTDLSPEEHK